MTLNCSYFFSQYLTPREFSYLSIVVAVLFSLYLFTLLKKILLGIFATIGFMTGSIINAMDRLSDGCVSDYLDFFGLFKYNIADLMITVSSIILIYLMVIYKHKEVANGK